MTSESAVFAMVIRDAREVAMRLQGDRSACRGLARKTTRCASPGFMCRQQLDNAFPHFSMRQRNTSYRNKKSILSKILTPDIIKHGVEVIF